MSSGTFGSGLTDSAGNEYNDPMNDFNDDGDLDVNDAISNADTEGITADNWKAKLEQAMPEIIKALAGSTGGATPTVAPKLSVSAPDVDFNGVMKPAPFQYKPNTRSNKK